MVGRARTSLWVEVDYVLENPYEGEMLAMDSLQPGEIAVMAAGGSEQIATLGELMSTAALKRGATGAVTDGLIRDVRRIRELRFPVFSAGYRPVDSKGRGMVTEHQVPVEISGVRIEPGDLIMGDVDGVVVVPRAVERHVLEIAWEKASAENNTREELERGVLLREVYAKYGVL
jgi:regulator of RNase E activity RraA